MAACFEFIGSIYKVFILSVSTNRSISQSPVMAECVDVATRMTEVTAQTTLVFVDSVQGMIRHILSNYTFLFNIFISGGFFLQFYLRLTL